MAATPRNRVQQLDARRLRAVDLLANGHTDTEAAAELHADRSTLWRWRQEPAFSAELARRREELWQATSDRLRCLLPHAALAVLKLGGVGSVDLGFVGPTDPEVIAESKARQRAQREYERADAEVRNVEQERFLQLRRGLANAD
jgi:hypothetical protein